MMELLTNIFNALGSIRIEANQAMTMAQCLNGLQELAKQIQELEAKANTASTEFTEGE